MSLGVDLSVYGYGYTPFLVPTLCFMLFGYQIFSVAPINSSSITISSCHFHWPEFELCWISVNPITQRLYHIVYIHKISKQYEYFNNDEDYNSVQRLHHIKYTHRVSFQYDFFHAFEDDCGVQRLYHIDYNS